MNVAEAHCVNMSRCVSGLSAPDGLQGRAVHGAQPEDIYKDETTSLAGRRKHRRYVLLSWIFLRVVSCRVVSCRVVSCRVVTCRVVSCRVVPCRVVSCRVVSCRVVSCRVVSCRVVSCRVVALVGMTIQSLSASLE